MANEELIQRKYLSTGYLRGEKFGEFEELNLGATSIRELKAVGLNVIPPSSIDFPFSLYKPLKKPESAKPDRVFLRRAQGDLSAICVAEHKAPGKYRTDLEIQRAAEQGLYSAAAVGAPIAVVSDGTKWKYVDVKSSLANKKVVLFSESRDFGPAVLSNLIAGDAGIAKDPAPLAEKVWQIIWHATKEEPKQCLLTFVEIFVLKFLSDNLPLKHLPDAYRFYSLAVDPLEFSNRHGTTSIEYYVDKVRPFIKSLFPDNTIATDAAVGDVFGLGTIVSKTSIINGFAFLRSSATTLSGFNRTFLEILREFEEFGPLTTIDPEFKLRLYETFLKKTAKQQRLGQFFTPRAVVRQMIRMARLDTLKDGSVVLDPAAGVGGFILEPPLLVSALAENVKFANGRAIRKIKFIGADVDPSTHVLAKANTLIHFTEAVRDPSVTISALNQLMAETFVLMNGNETLGTLESPPRETVDVILTNPPYVTKGSGIYKEEVKEAGIGANGVDLRDYYDRAGLGVEALFLRYIAGALKPGGRAFVIVPLGLLNRTDPGPKKRLLEQCNVIASIALPRNTFFNTAQLTYVLVLEKRHSIADERPKVFCGIARSIGESLNWERVATPDENDLSDIADLFVRCSEGEDVAAIGSPIVKIANAEAFSENDRWDVNRFWSEEELVALGNKESAIARTDFIDEMHDELSEVLSDLAAAKSELTSLEASPMAEFSLGDAAHFSVRSGTRVTGKQIRDNPGKLPIFSCFRTDAEVKGYVDEAFFASKGGIVEDKPIVTVNANGASVGKVFLRPEKCGITDDVNIVQLTSDAVDLAYLAVALQDSVNRGGFLYEAKLFTTRVKELRILVPIDGSGNPDLTKQRSIASAVRRFNALRMRLRDLGDRSASARTA